MHQHARAAENDLSERKYTLTNAPRFVFFVLLIVSMTRRRFPIVIVLVVRGIRCECILKQLYKINASLFGIVDNGLRARVCDGTVGIVGPYRLVREGISRHLITSCVTHPQNFTSRASRRVNGRRRIGEAPVRGVTARKRP